MEEKKILQDHIHQIKKTAEKLDHPITIMEICGGHTNIILKYGIRDLLPDNIRLISGPGCPVCVSSQHDIDCMIELANQNIPIATYGDMMRVPGSNYSLEDVRAMKGNVKEIYATTEVLSLKKKFPDIVFFGIGFETTAPMTTFLLEHDIMVYSVHKLVPPAMKLLLDGQVRIDGFIDPGHVSTIIGLKPYQDIHVPQVITGFTAERILRGIRILVELIYEKKNMVINAYPEAVHINGNKIAQQKLADHFYIADSEWRGLGYLPKSGLEVKKDKLNAKIAYADIIKKVPMPKKTLCRCGEILKGLIEPMECPLYRKICTPDNPQGSCMVSDEGSCAISYRYGK
jgi:hydrogenase expression/formation protein HypD